MLSDNAGTSLPADASHNVQIQYMAWRSARESVDKLTSWLLLRSTLPIFHFCHLVFCSVWLRDA